MRWDNLRIEAEEATRLPGYRDGAVVRRFDAPEALDMRFYEVQAKSALNRVPEASAMPFRWTINPYRGCSHACVYCLSGDTQVLMADGSLRPIADLRAGDEILGTEEAGGARRLVPTTVADQWSSVKPAYRVTLSDGTELVGSADHRFLASDGWRHVADGQGAAAGRAHLSIGDELVGFGMPGPGAIPDDQYRQGYLCGLLRGDPRLGVATRHQRPDEPAVHALRRARVGSEALDRAHEYFAAAGIEVERAALTATGPLPAAIVGPDGVAPALRPLISWPRTPSTAWRQGFLAGMFDTEGSVGDGTLRITSEDPVLLSWAASSLRHLGFLATREPPWPGVSHEVVMDGGALALVRFRHAVGPARPLAPALAGEALRADAADLRVVAIEPLGDGAQRLYDITTGTGDFVANGIVSHNCFARPTHTYLDFGAGRDFEREIVVKVNVPEVLRAELRRPSWKGEHVAMGTNTDPYQWVEGRYKLMPGIWEALRDFRNPCSVLTKSPLVLRDLPLLKEIAQVTDVSANLSVPTIDEKAWRATEPHTPNPRARLEAVAELNRNGIPTGILVAPLMPGINDDPAQVERIVQTAIEAGATSIGGIGLHLRREVRDVFMEWLRACRPDLVEHYEELYARGAYLPPVERERLAGLLHRAGARRARPFRRDPALVRGRAAASAAAREEGARDRPPLTAPAAVQEALF